MPQLKTSERETLSSKLTGDDAAKGLVVYDTDLNCLEFWNGTTWISLCSDAMPDCSATVYPALNSSYDFLTGATIADLIAAIGDNVQLYDAVTDGNLYDNPSTLLNPALTYYVEQKIGLCTRRVPVAVTISTAAVSGSATIDACVTVMYDFQYQTLAVYGTGGGAPTQGQWSVKRRGEADSEYKPIPNANGVSYKIPANFVRDVFRKMYSGTDNNDGVVFKVVVWNVLNTPATRVSTTSATEFDVEFIDTYGNDPEDGVALNANYNKAGNPVPYYGLKFAYLNLGVERDKDGYNACDFGSLYQWGRITDGHEKITWTKDSNHNIAFDAATQNNQKSALDLTGDDDYDSNPLALAGFGDPFYQVAKEGYKDKFLYNNATAVWNTVNTTYQYFWATSSYAKTSNDPCPTGWHVPTAYEFGAIYSGTPLNNTCTWRSNIPIGVNTSRIAGGYIVTYGDGSDKSKRIFMPAVGYRDDSDGTLGYTGSIGDYWSSTYSLTMGAYIMGFDIGGVGAGDGNGEAYGFSVRCVAE